ncbi:gamma carbonic anhydrase family protein [Tsukamurella sp. 8F]|uniref:gamma carbonic anhydrase family protein n=1 Tax=unclassified Tsukamurella TaxID=2633480 RepID=UPI0023B89A15|nr:MULTISPECIES: gamma carbonic anhydrase family protein [unclassified Tsukamurella]MDF0530690.1 gamma carbonic anhydrase family protein [Tsukamurella sp. 8J]MDF0587891.1 gamma carbonic anhydrase family protein [Tsukamurella sp. 8F]
MTVRRFGAVSPQLDETAWVAEEATVIGDAHLGAGVGVYYNAVIRADSARIEIGEASNIQDGVVVHADPGVPCTIGARVSVGHNAVLHGCTVGDDVLVGMGATVLNGAVIGAESLIAANALITEGTVIPPRSMVVGVPAKVRRELTDDEVARVKLNSSVYVELTKAHATLTDRHPE